MRAYTITSITVLGLLQYAAEFVLAAPNPPSYPISLTGDTLPEGWVLAGFKQPLEVIRINLEDYKDNLNENGTAEYKPTASELQSRHGLDKRWVHWEATVQAWRSSTSCSGSPAVSWFPASFARLRDVGHARCYEIFENGERQTINSIFVTGPWGPNPCYIAGFRSGTCNYAPYRETQLRLVGQCNSRPGDYAFQSFVIQCF